jgi:O-antigen ligase
MEMAARIAVADRWGRLGQLGAVGFVAMLYANPANWWPTLERARLAAVSVALCAGAVFLERFVSGARLRVGGAPAAFLLGYLGLAFLSVTWSVAPDASGAAATELLKLAVVYLALQNALETPERLRAFFVVAGVAALAPALGGIDVWLSGDQLVEGYRTHWVGLFRDPNRLAMGMVAVLPLTLCALATVRRPWLRALLIASVAAQIAAVVLTHSRSGAIAGAVAALCYLMRGGPRSAQAGWRRWALLGAIAVGVLAFAPRSFWERQGTITSYRDDASVEGRRAAWSVLGEIAAERPLGGVGLGAFINAWDRYAPLSAGGRRYVPHNIFMEIVGEVGIPAFILFATFVFWMLARLWRAGDHPIVGREARAVFAALAGYLLCLSVNGYSLSWFLYFLLACAAVCVRLAREMVPETGRT